MARSSYPVSFSRKDVNEMVEGMASDNGWKDFEITSQQLFLQPYYFFSYDAYTEKKQEETGQLVVDDIQRGKIALNALSGELEEDMASLAEKKPKEHQSREMANAEFEEPSILKEEARKIAPIKLASSLEVPRSNVEISGFFEAYVPFWVVSVSLEDRESFDFTVSAVDGSVYGELDVPVKPKTALDLVGETVSELRDPGAWAEYSRGVASSVYNSRHLHVFGSHLLRNRLMQLVVVLLLVFLYLSLFVFR